MRQKSTVIVQRQNKETGPGILLSLLEVYKSFPGCTVVVFPSDHFILEEDLFMNHVQLACRAVARDGSRIGLLGVEPQDPDPEYGYIVPGAEIQSFGLNSLKRIELFVEKPNMQAAKKIATSGVLWNTLVIVSRCETLMEAIQCTTPQLYRAFQPVRHAIGTPDEQRVLEQVYRELRPVSFSRNVLEALPFERRQALLVMRVEGVRWSDWGTEDQEELSTKMRVQGG